MYQYVNSLPDNALLLFQNPDSGKAFNFYSIHYRCEAMSTYPRTYDMLHADSIFTLYKDR